MAKFVMQEPKPDENVTTTENHTVHEIQSGHPDGNVTTTENHTVHEIQSGLPSDAHKSSFETMLPSAAATAAPRKPDNRAVPDSGLNIGNGTDSFSNKISRLEDTNSDSNKLSSEQGAQTVSTSKLVQSSSLPISKLNTSSQTTKNGSTLQSESQDNSTLQSISRKRPRADDLLDPVKTGGNRLMDSTTKDIVCLPAEYSALCMLVLYHGTTWPKLGQSKMFEKKLDQMKLEAAWNKLDGFVLLYGSHSWTYCLMGCYVAVANTSSVLNAKRAKRFLFTGDPGIEPNLACAVELVWHDGHSSGLWTVGPADNSNEFWMYRTPVNSDTGPMWFECFTSVDSVNGLTQGKIGWKPTTDVRFVECNDSGHRGSSLCSEKQLNAISVYHASASRYGCNSIIDASKSLEMLVRLGG